MEDPTMRKRIHWLLPGLTVLCAAGFVLCLFRLSAQRDDTPPVITFAEDVLSRSVEDGADALLDGVSAFDDRDGDVTASLVTEGISAIREDHTAVVTYAAFDRAGNVTKAQRTVLYTDYEGPRFALTTPLIFRSSSYVDLFQYVSAYDMVDGDLSDNIKATIVDENGTLSEVGIHQVQLRVTNSMGDTARLTLPVEVYQTGTYNATAILSDYLIYLKAGSSFDPATYLRSLHTGYVEYTISQLPADEVSIQLENNVRSNTPGVYDVTYTVSYGNYTGYTRLIVIVEE